MNLKMTSMRTFIYEDLNQWGKQRLIEACYCNLGKEYKNLWDKKRLF